MTWAKEACVSSLEGRKTFYGRARLVPWKVAGTDPLPRSRAIVNTR